MKGRIIKDWSKVNFRNPEDVKKVRGAMQHFMVQLATKTKHENKELVAAMQQFTTKGDFPAEILQVLEKFHATDNWDTGYERLFDIRDFEGTNESGFDILDVQSGLAFSKVAVGQKAQVYKASGSKVSVSFDQYGGGLGWNRVWFDDRKYWQIEDTAIAFRNAAYSSRASNFYALIEAISGVDLAWQGATADSEVNRDIKTIDQACLNILEAVKNKGYGVSANSRIRLLAPLALRRRLTAALNQLNQSVQGSPNAIQYNIEPIYSLMLTDNTKYYVALPGIKNKGGYRQDLTLFGLFDPLTYADTVVGWMRYGGAIGDTDQWQKCATA